MTFAQGQDFISESNVGNPWVPEQVFGTAWTDHPDRDPVARFREAYDQERERAAERLGRSLEFVQLWP